MRLCCICVSAAADNASRCKAVRGTTVIPPGTDAAATIEQQLAHLAAAGGPVLDLRRLDCKAAAAAAGRQLIQQQHQQQDGRRQRDRSYKNRPAPAAAATRVSPVLATATHIQGGGWGWQAAATAALQSALVSASAEQAAAAAGAHAEALEGGVADAVAHHFEAAERERPEQLAALVEKVAGLVPDVQLLVLPVLLPGGR